MKPKFYRVGGCVRDAILGIESKDIDYAVEADSFDAMRNAIIERGGKIFVETPQYLTIRAHVPELGACDFVLCRKDGEYVDGRRPETVEAGTLYDDLARRDFTINAIAIEIEGGGLIDPYAGVKDINDRLIRCVGDPAKRFGEDKLRILRAIRFAITKDFRLDGSINNYIHQNKDLFGVSQERIRDELLKCFKHDTVRTLRLLSHYNLDRLIFKQTDLWLEPTLKKV